LESLEPAVVVSHISRKTSEIPRISCTQHRTRPRVRLSLKERRIKFTEPTKLHRKSGIWGTRDLFKGCENKKKRPQISPLRYALSKNISTKGPRNCRSLGYARDDKGKGHRSIEGGCWTRRFSSPWVGYRPMATPVETTLLFEGGIPRFQEKFEILAATELSSRPERSVVERSAVSFTHPLCCPFSLPKTFPLNQLWGSTNVSRATLSKPRSREEGNCRW
jgi:hypothetical protein